MVKLQAGGAEVPTLRDGISTFMLGCVSLQFREKKDSISHRVVSVCLHMMIQMDGYQLLNFELQGISLGLKSRELEMCPRFKMAVIATKGCSWRQTFELCDHGFCNYIIQKC